MDPLTVEAVQAMLASLSAGRMIRDLPEAAVRLARSWLAQRQEIADLRLIARDACDALRNSAGDYRDYCLWCDRDVELQNHPKSHDSTCPVRRLAEMPR